jgi:hypothetical protein
MFPLFDLAQIAEDLRKRSIEAYYEIVYGLHGGMEGLDIAGEFFPLWELNLPENRAAVEQFDFAAIKARRGPNWSLEPPRFVRDAGA